MLGLLALIFGSLLPAQEAYAAACDRKPSHRNTPVITHNLSQSYCELCGYGYVTVVINNPYQGATMTDMQLTEQLYGLVYEPTAPNSITYSINGGPSQTGISVSGTSTLTFGNLPNLAPGNGNQVRSLAITFAVRRVNAPETLLFASNRQAQATLRYDTVYTSGGRTETCGEHTTTSSRVTIPLREPEPQIVKTGWNYDAGQRENTASDPVYGNNNDDIVWRIQINNRGRAALQDLRFDDLMESGNMVVRYACPTAAAANAVAANNGVLPANSACVPASNAINDFIVTGPFGASSSGTYPWGGRYEVDVPAGGSTSIYLVGKVTADGSCITSKVNRVSDVQWGCDAQPPAGGISATSTGAVPGDTARLYTRYLDGGANRRVRVERRLEGTTRGQPVGTKGTMTITITNVSGGSIRFSDSLAYHLRDVLPPEYVVDPTFTPTVSMSPAYGSYPGMVDRITWINPVPGTFPLTTTDPTVPLGNTAPEFKLSSSTVHPVYPDQRNMMRHGDALTIRFRVVLIKSEFYDRVANLDVTPEAHTAAASFTDPPYQARLDNTLYVRFDTFCADQGTQEFRLTGNGSGNPNGSQIPAHPEDLDIAIGGDVFILTNDRSQELTLPVRVTNNGGHDARDYRIFVTFGATMDVVRAPSYCSRRPVSGDPPQPDPWKVWVGSPDPANAIGIPSTATVYQCSSNTPIGPGQTVTLEFGVVKTQDPARLLLDDLTFRADVVGEITLSDGTPLWFPAPIRRADGQLDRANNYSLDTVWARVIGFNLIKHKEGECSENSPALFDSSGSGRPVERVEIGEECTFRIETGGWFGFETPGFAYIAVQNIQVVDQTPDGQAYISSTDPYLASTPLIRGVTLNPASLQPVDRGWFDWRFNVTDPERIEQADEWFRVNVTTRLLNDSRNRRAAPNVHGANSPNILNSTFDATFHNNNTNRTEKYTLGPHTVGYPREAIRRVDLTVTEPHLEVVKEVCNESLYGFGPSCSNWTTHTAEGDTYDSYIYRITVRNRAEVNGLASAPAYDLVVTDNLDPSDLMYVVPFESDGLDNDADGQADSGVEGAISDNVVLNGAPAVITFSHTHSSGLRRLNPGAEVSLFYRVRVDHRAAPLQRLTNTVKVSYDSLEGSVERPSGNQTVAPRPNGDIGGARVYETEPAAAITQIMPLRTFPKLVTRLSNTPLGTAQPQRATIGEEVEFRLEADLPVARLRDFRIHDPLPAGLSCVEAPVVDLNQAPYSAAGFRRPDGSAVPPIAPQCTATHVTWEFGDVVLTRRPEGASVFRFPVTFIARVDNIADNRADTLLSNGQPATATELYYVDETGTSHTLAFAQVDLLVSEPAIALTKSMGPASLADAGDELTVTVTATNTGTVNAYNLRILDDLRDRNLTFIPGSVSGNSPDEVPDTVDLSGGDKQPIFVWSNTKPLAPGETLAFSFRVRVDDPVQPLEVLDNRIQASWTSLPDRSTALNSENRIGPDGSAEGMRNGALPHLHDPLNNYEAEAEQAGVSVPPPTITKTDILPDVVPTIGEHQRFRLEIRLPEGTTQAVRIEDALDSGSTRYVFRDAPGFEVSYAFENIVAINGQPPAAAAFLSVPADGASGSINWDIGEVLTQSENDIGGGGAIEPKIVITYYARINNDLQTRRGQTLRNIATLAHRHGETGATETHSAVTDSTVVQEPALSVTKQAFVEGRPVTGPVQGGDTVDYLITVTNHGDATAWDVNIVDSLPGGLALHAGPIVTINGAPVAGFNPVASTDANGHKVWGRENGDSSLAIPAGGTLEFRYSVFIDGPSGEVHNTVWVDWTSLSGDSDYERHGFGCPNVVEPNNYCVSARFPADTVDTTALHKSVVEDSYASGTSTATDAVVRVGDSVVYRLAVALQGGRTRDLRIEDVLPAGMVFDAVLSINGDTTPDYTAPPGSGFSYAPITAAQVPAQGDAGRLVWELGTITSTVSQTLEILYRAKVMPDAGIAHQPSRVLSNQAYLYYTLATGEPAPTLAEPRLQAVADVTLLQPVIDAIAKSDRGGLTSPANVNIGDDIMQFRLQACNADGLAPAYGVLIRDDLPPELDVATMTAPVVSIGGVALPPSDYAYSAPAGRGGSLEVRLLVPLNPGQCVSVDYDIGFHTDVPANSSWSNRAVLPEYWSLPEQSGQRYGPLGPAAFTMQNPASHSAAPLKKLVSAAEAAVGALVEYEITVPGAPLNAVLHDVVISDSLGERLELVSAVESSGNNLSIVQLDGGQPGEVRLAIAQIPAGQQAVVRLTARVANNAQANAGDVIVNSASYTFRLSPEGSDLEGGAGTADPVRIVEPRLELAKTVVNLSNPGAAPVAGDTLRYTVTLVAAGSGAGDDYSSAFDVSLFDNLSAGLAYVSGSASVSGGNSIGEPIITGDGQSSPQSLRWSLADNNADIDVAEGGTVAVTYDVRVLNSVLPGQTLSNSASAHWTSLDGASAHERTGSGSPAWNDYRVGPVTATIAAQNTTSLTKTRLSDTFGAADARVRIGDFIDYELRLGLQQGTYHDVVLTDTLPQGLAFAGVASVDRFGQPSSLTPSVSGDPATGPTTVTFDLGTVVNAADSATDDLVIVYRARVLNEVHPHTDSLTLTNAATLRAGTAEGIVVLTDDETVTVLQPRLVLAKSAQISSGAVAVEAGEQIVYTVDIRNEGTAPAYDAVLVDTLPQGLREGGIRLLGIELIDLASSATVAALPDLMPAYDPATGMATWHFDTGTADAYTIAPGQALRVTYQVSADAGVGAGMALTNMAQAVRYYSFDNDAVPAGGSVGQRQIYGPSNTAQTTLNTPAPQALRKANTQPTAAVGELFSYRITVPAQPVNTTLYDVRILDDLTASAADMSFVSVAKVLGSRDWTPVNLGSATNLIIADPVNGIDIPAGEQIVVEITVVLNDSPANVTGLLFDNTATYTYNRLKGFPGSVVDSPAHADTSDDMTIVGPDRLQLEKTGPATMRVGSVEAFTIVVTNAGTGPAWGVTVDDRLPEGMCEAAPANVAVRVEHADGSVVATLAQGTDYELRFDGGEGGCLFSLDMRSEQAVIGPAQRLVISYDAALEPVAANGAALTNVAGATQWYGGDPASGRARRYAGSLTDGTPDDMTDEQDAHTFTVLAPVVSVEKSVVNASTGQNPGTDARPGDTLRYTLTVRNQSDFAIPDAALVDELDSHFAPGTLRLISIPSGADSTHTDPAGGANGTGLVDIRNLGLGAQGAPDDTLTVVFEAQLARVLDSGTRVLNRARLSGTNLMPVASNETETLIASSPSFRVLKISQDLTGDPNVLMAGDILRYTLTVKNIGTENAVGAMLRDQIPAHTSYVPGSTRLNGVAVPDPSPGVSPLAAGLFIHAPENPTPGAMRADDSEEADNVATVTFEVRIDTDVLDGTLIANQGFVTASGAGNSGPIDEQPSDDPRTPVVDDPTVDIVGNLPLLGAHKSVHIEVDNGTPGIVDPEDTLRYTIRIDNFGAIPATDVRLTDLVPANTTYIADSVTLNGQPVGRPDGGVSPLAAGILVHSPDQAVGSGVISARSHAIVTFDVKVDAGVPAGTLIVNQGEVASRELPTELTDADGDRSNGHQPTVVVVGEAQQLAIEKNVRVVDGGAAEAGKLLEYTVRVSNIGSLPAIDLAIEDDLSPLLGGQIAYVDGSGTLNGAVAGVSFTGDKLRADFAAVYGDLQPGAVAVLRFRARINPDLPIGTRITNTAEARWNKPVQTVRASASIDVGGIPGSGMLNGRVWHDADFDKAAGDNERKLAGWTVEIHRNGLPIGRVETDAQGAFSIRGLAPNDLSGDRYELHFIAPGAGSNTAKLGQADSPFTNGLHHIADIAVGSGSNLQNLNLPIDPNGVVYDSVYRTPIAGATLTMVRAGSRLPLPDSCFDDPVQQNQVTGADGYYKFDLNFGSPACPPGADYLIQVTAPAGGGYTAAPSRIIVPASDESTTAFSVPECLSSGKDAVPATADRCEAAPSEFAPSPAVTPRAPEARYYLHLRLDNAQMPGHSQLYNNHIAIDPELDQALALTKTAALVNVSRGQMVPYTITLSNTLGVALYELRIVDTLPAGFKYVEGSARIDGRKLEPRVDGRVLSWDLPDLEPDAQHSLQLLAVVGAGVSEGNYVNRAQAFNARSGEALSGEAAATVRVVPDPTFDCTDIIGKVFDDANLNGIQDEGERGLAGVRIVSARGLIVTTDQHGRFHLTCADIPDEDRGSNFILKLDDRSLPAGYRLTTDNPLVLRATRGKALRFNFGASLHRVVGLSVADEVFEPGATVLRLQWVQRLDLLMAELQKSPSVLRISYLADVEDAALVQRRIDALKQQIRQRWEQLECCRPLTIETETFWRRGGPPVGGR